MTLTCALCSTQVDAELEPGVALGWASSRAAGVTHHLCPTCARQQVRDIEAKFAGVG